MLKYLFCGFFKNSVSNYKPTKYVHDDISYGSSSDDQFDDRKRTYISNNNLGNNSPRKEFIKKVVMPGSSFSHCSFYYTKENYNELVKSMVPDFNRERYNINVKNSITL